MFLDFELLLVIITLITGSTLAWNYFRRRAIRKQGAVEGREGWWVELCRSLFPVILIVLIIRSFVVEPFRIPSGSMIPTLLPGDFILVNKFSYGIRLPALRTRVVDTGSPERGDLVVFKYPRDPSQDYIKRVVGLPGDQISFRNQRLLINGEPLPRGLVEDFDDKGGRLYTERAGDLEYNIVQYRDFGNSDLDATVPEGHYFMVGDNRDRSSDSRFWGPVPEEHLVGRAFLIWMSWDTEDNNVNWNRIGERIQ